jgi:hypothetical protein
MGSFYGGAGGIGAGVFGAGGFGAGGGGAGGGGFGAGVDVAMMLASMEPGGMPALMTS